MQVARDAQPLGVGGADGGLEQALALARGPGQPAGQQQHQRGVSSDQGGEGADGDREEAVEDARALLRRARRR